MLIKLRFALGVHCVLTYGDAATHTFSKPNTTPHNYVLTFSLYLTTTAICETTSRLYHTTLKASKRPKTSRKFAMTPLTAPPGRALHRGFSLVLVICGGFYVYFFVIMCVAFRCKLWGAVKDRRRPQFYDIEALRMIEIRPRFNQLPKFE